MFLDRLGDVRWVTTGPAAVNPEAGPETRLAVNEEEVDSTITVEATAPDAGMSNPGSHEGVTTASVTFTSKVPAGIQIFKADGDASGWTPGTPLVRFVAWSETAGDLPAELKTLDSLRRGRNTPFAEAETPPPNCSQNILNRRTTGGLLCPGSGLRPKRGPPERIIHNAKKGAGVVAFARTT